MRRTIQAWWREGELWYVAVGLANLVQGTSSVLIPLSISVVLDRSVASLGLLSSLTSLVGVIGSLVWGRLSDVAHRRKPFVVLSYAVVGISLLLMAIVRTFEQLALLNMMLNFFWVANASVSVLIVIENQKQGRWETKIGHMNQIGAIGYVLGLVVGSVAMAGGRLVADEAMSIRSSFLLIGVIGLAAALLAIRWVPRGGTAIADRSFRGVVLALGNFLVEKVRYGPFHVHYRLDLRRLVRHFRSPEGLRPGTKRFLAATFTAFTALGFFGIPLPLLLAERFLLPSSVVFLYFAIQNAGVVIAYPLAARRIKRSGNRRVQMGALSIRLLLFIAAVLYLTVTPAIPSTLVLVAVFALYGFTWSYFQLTGIALASRLAKPENRGLALGLYNGLAGVGWIVAGVGSGYLAEWVGYQAAFAAAAAFLIVTLVLLRRVPDPPPPSDVTEDSGERVAAPGPAPQAAGGDAGGA